MPFIPSSILRAYRWRVEESGVRDEVCDEAQDVDGGEIDGCSSCGASAVVEEGLGVEGGGPADGVDPAEGVGY